MVRSNASYLQEPIIGANNVVYKSAGYTQNDNNENCGQNFSRYVTSASSSTSSLNSTSSLYEQHSCATGVIMVVPQPQQQYQTPIQQNSGASQSVTGSVTVHSSQYQTSSLQYTPVQHILSLPIPYTAATHSPAEGAIATASSQSSPASVILPQVAVSQQTTPTLTTPLITNVPCAVHHPQQHQQQMAVMAAMQLHLATNSGGGGSLPHSAPMNLHSNPVGAAASPSMVAANATSNIASGGVAFLSSQPQNVDQSLENGQNSTSTSSNGSPVNSKTSTSSSGNLIDNNATIAVVAGGVGSTSSQAIPPPPPPPPPSVALPAAATAATSVYIQYQGDFYPTEYFIAPHPNEGICPQHSQPTAICTIPSEYGPAMQMISQNRPLPPNPMSVPVQMSTGQVMQQYVNENSTLTHVILSPQQYQQLHAGHIPSILTANGTSHFYTHISSGFPAPGGTNTVSHYNPTSNGTISTALPLPPPPNQHSQQSSQLVSSSKLQSKVSFHQQHHHPNSSNISPAFPSHVVSSPSYNLSGSSNNYHKDERAQRQHTKLLRKLEKQREYNSELHTVSGQLLSSTSRRHEGSHQINKQNTSSRLYQAPLKQTSNTPSTITKNTAHCIDCTVNNNNSLNQYHPGRMGPNLRETTIASGNNNSLPNNTNTNNSKNINSNNTNHNANVNDNVEDISVVSASGSETCENNNNSNNNSNNGNNNTADNDNNASNFTDNVDDEEDDYQCIIIEQLSAIQKPDVTDISSRSAKISWVAPQGLNDTSSQSSSSTQQLININELRYNVLLSDRIKDSKYKSLYTGSSYDCIVQDLQPGQEYVVRLQVHYEHLHGNASEPQVFTTPPCEPDQPLPPRLVMRTKNSLHLRWTNPFANGATIQHYILQYDDGRPTNSVNNALSNNNNNAIMASNDDNNIKFVDAIKIKAKQYILTKLQPSTIYNFRLAAVNEIGVSVFSTISSYRTADNPPPTPKPPVLQSASSSSLQLTWERRQVDGTTCIYILQMLNRESGPGYLNIYNGSDCYYKYCQLKRASIYYFRLRVENEAGASAWSSEVSYKTTAERPGRPGKPHPKGRIHGTQFRVQWDSPTDNGGAPIQKYFLEITVNGGKFSRIYSGTETETTCDRLQPGTIYQLRASCENSSGVSPYSEVAHITSDAVVPTAPPPPYYDNPPGPYAAILRLNKPDYNGGAPVNEFELNFREIKPVDESGSECASTPQIIYKGKESYYVVKNLEPGCIYEVQLRAYNRIGCSPWSSWYRFITAGAAPNSPEHLKVQVKSANHVHISWQQPSNIGGSPIIEYHLESATVLPALMTAKGTTTGTTAFNERNNNHISVQQLSSVDFQTCYQGPQTSTDLRNLLPFTMYYFRVNACNMIGVSKWSPLINVQTPAAVPGAPQIHDFEFTYNEVTLFWSEPDSNGSAITGYIIEYGDQTITTNDTNTEYTITSLEPETSYKFRIQAVNAIGCGPYSQHVKLLTLPSPPSPPTLECSGVGHNFIKLKWGDGRNLDFLKYYVEMFVQRGKEYQVVYSGSNCMCKVTKLQERTSYTFRICAGNDSSGIGDYSDEFIVTTSATLPNSIKAPRIAQTLNGGSNSLSGSGGGHHQNNTSNSNATINSVVIPSGLLPETPSVITGFGNLMLGVPITLEWQHSKNSFPDRVEYLLQYSIGKDGTFKKIYRGTETKFTIENLEPGGVYQFRVCPIRVTASGEDLSGTFTSVFRYQVPELPSLDEFDGNILNNATVTANVFASMSIAHSNSSYQGIVSNHVQQANNYNNHNHHANQTSSRFQHHSSRIRNSTTASGKHHRSVSASAATSDRRVVSKNTEKTNVNNFIPLETIGNDFNSNFNGCNDPRHQHHYHHNTFPDNDRHNVSTSLQSATSSYKVQNGNQYYHRQQSQQPQSSASLIAVNANQIFANNAILLQAAAAAANSSLSNAAHCQGGGSQHHHHGTPAGILKRFTHKVNSMYLNRKRFSDQEKAAIFMISFLFLTFVFATLVKMFMR